MHVTHIHRQLHTNAAITLLSESSSSPFSHYLYFILFLAAVINNMHEIHCHMNVVLNPAFRP